LPFLSALYAAGIAAIASDRHDILATLQLTRRVESRRTDEPSLLVYHAIEASSQAGWDALRTLPSLKQTRVPFSEYMFDYLRPVLANAIGLDVEFEDGFDRFEVLNAVWFASERGDQRSPWAPPGRFAWKYHGVDRGGVFTEIEREARDAQAAWPITASGLFRGSHEHFLGFAKRYREEVLNRLNWY
jgi:hypothetical protein